MQTIDVLETSITKHPFLAGLDPHFYHFFTECATMRRLKANEDIFREGNYADKFFLIKRGKVALETFVPGCGMVTIQTLGPGEALGWSWLFPPREWHFSASATEPTELIEFDASSLRYKAEENRDFAHELLTVLRQSCSPAFKARECN